MVFYAGMRNHCFGAQPGLLKSACFWLLALGTVTLSLGGFACKSKHKPTDSGATAAGSVSGAGASAPSMVAGRSFVVPSGPAFAIEAGVGLGPVRFGATVATIERLMGSKCDEVNDKFCRYIPAGVEFELSAGVVSGIVVYRHDRPVPGNPVKLWGRTRCAIPPDLSPRVILSYVHSRLGKPLTSEPVTATNPNRTVLRETYPGLVLEFDRGEYTQDLVLGAIRVVKLDKPKP